MELFSSFTFTHTLECLPTSIYLLTKNKRIPLNGILENSTLYRYNLNGLKKGNIFLMVLGIAYMLLILVAYSLIKKVFTTVLNI